jgi:hypothetical protein
MDSPMCAPAVLRFSTAHVHGHSAVAVAADIDAATEPDLYTHLRDAVDASTGNTARVVAVVGLSQVTFMHAGGLTALLRSQAHARGARLRRQVVARRLRFSPRDE